MTGIRAHRTINGKVFSDEILPISPSWFHMQGQFMEKKQAALFFQVSFDPGSILEGRCSSCVETESPRRLSPDPCPLAIHLSIYQQPTHLRLQTQTNSSFSFYFTTNWSIDSNPTNPPPNHQRSDPITSIIRQRPLWLMQKGNWHLCSYVCGHSLCMELIPCLCLSGCPSAVYIPPPVFIARLQSCSFSVCKTAPADLRPPPAS